MKISSSVKTLNSREGFDCLLIDVSIYHGNDEKSTEHAYKTYKDQNRSRTKCFQEYQFQNCLSELFQFIDQIEIFASIYTLYLFQQPPLLYSIYKKCYQCPLLGEVLLVDSLTTLILQNYIYLQHLLSHLTDSAHHQNYYYFFQMYLLSKSLAYTFSGQIDTGIY